MVQKDFVPGIRDVIRKEVPKLAIDPKFDNMLMFVCGFIHRMVSTLRYIIRKIDLFLKKEVYL